MSWDHFRISVSSDEGLRALPQIGLHCLQVMDKRRHCQWPRAPVENPLPCMENMWTCPCPASLCYGPKGGGECLGIEHSASFNYHNN